MFLYGAVEPTCRMIASLRRTYGNSGQLVAYHARLLRGLGRDAEALEAFHYLCRTEGIIPALESSHALAYAAKLARTMEKDQIMIVNLSGRGDKDINTIAEIEGISL